uniref:Phosphomannomutase/phosphoglucomutase n=1 Tax=Ammonifex degensii TaxID=42838 RepID=A0A7C2E3W2_9THEO
MGVNPYIFRAYDIRGVADRDLDPETVALLGRALGTFFTARGDSRVVVGRDNRLSSPELRDALVQGLTDTGCAVSDTGVVVTPILYFACQDYDIPNGVMITGSHNPPEENGFKIVAGDGTIYGEQIQYLRKLMESGSFDRGSGTVHQVDAAAAYLPMLREKVRLGPRRLKVAVDCGNGTAALFAEEILRGWGCEVVPLFCVSDGTFPHHQPDPVKTANLAELRRAVLEEGCDLGVGYDGDADRLGVVDEKGNIIWGDRLMILFWREILPRHPGTPCIVEVKCSQALVDEIIRLGGRPLFYKTGHSLVKAKMKEVGAVFTGEMSGHFFFADEYYGFDDAFYATGRLLRILSHTNKPLSALLADLPQYYATAETRIPCPDEQKFAVVARLVEHFRKTRKVIDVDGARVLFEDGWGLVRASNTQPVLVARCEAKTQAGLAEICSIIREAISSTASLPDFSWEF